MDPIQAMMVHLSVDADDAFDYENAENAKFTVKDLKHILAMEILEVQQESQQRGR